MLDKGTVGLLWGPGSGLAFALLTVANLRMGVFCTGLSQFLFFKSLEGLEARTAGMIIALEPVYAIIGAWWLFGEQPSLRMAAGAALIVLTTILAAARKASAGQGDASRCAH